MGSLALKQGFEDVFLTTYDIIRWDKVSSHYNFPSHFDRNDFNESLIQVIGDLSDYEFFEKNLDILNNADLIFMDGPKDSKFEYKWKETLKN